MYCFAVGIIVNECLRNGKFIVFVKYPSEPFF